MAVRKKKLSAIFSVTGIHHSGRFADRQCNPQLLAKILQNLVLLFGRTFQSRLRVEMQHAPGRNVAMVHETVKILFHVLRVK